MVLNILEEFEIMEDKVVCMCICREREIVWVFFLFKY